MLTSECAVKISTRLFYIFQHSLSNPLSSRFPSHFNSKLNQRRHTMTSMLQPPGDNARKDLSVGSIPTLLEEESNYSPSRLTVNGNGTTSAPDGRKYSDSSLPSATAYAKSIVTQQKPSKSSRRSSLGLGLLGGKSDTNKSGKRRSSIAVVFLGRRNSKVCSNSCDRRSNKFSNHFRNFTVEGTDDRKSGEISTKIIRVGHRKRSASDNNNNARLRDDHAGEKTTTQLFVGHENGET